MKYHFDHISSVHHYIYKELIKRTSVFCRPFLIVLLSMTCLTAVAACSFGDDEETGSGDIVTVGQTLPSFSVVMADSSSIATDSLLGRPSVIVFFNTTCSDCQRELPIVQQIYEELGDSVNFVCISRAEGAEDIAEYWSGNELTLPYSAQSDRAIYNLFATITIPRIYVSNSANVVTAKFVEKAGYKKLRAAIDENLSE